MAKRGRPRSAHPTERVDIRLPQPVFDAVCEAARRARMPLATLIRRMLTRRFLPGEKSEQPTPP